MTMTAPGKTITMYYHRIIVSVLAMVAFACFQSANASTACETADAYVEAKLIEEAIKTLKMQQKPDKCVMVSLKKIAAAKTLKSQATLERKLMQAQMLQATGNYAEAIKVLQSATINMAADNNIINKLNELKKAKIDAEFRYVKELADNGMQDEALKALKNTLKNNPDSKIPENLEHLNGGSIKNWRKAKLWLQNYAIPAAEILLAVFLGCLIAHFIWRWILTKPLLAIEAFDDVGISQKPGKGVTALMQTAYQDFARGHGTSATRIKGNLEAVSLPSAIQHALPGPLKNHMIQALLALFDKIMPRRTYTVGGYLQNSESKGAGLTIRIIIKKQQAGSITLWESDYRGKDVTLVSANPGTNVDQTGDFEALAEYAAIWLLFTLKHGFGLRSVFFRCYRMWQIKQRLGTRSWRAYAMFRAGYRAEQAKANNEAKELYVSALREDSMLSIAKINLARLARREDMQSSKQLARSLWQDCKTEGDKRIAYFSYPHEQSHYAAMYSLASLDFDDAKDHMAHNLA